MTISEAISSSELGYLEGITMVRWVKGNFDRVYVNYVFDRRDSAEVRQIKIWFESTANGDIELKSKLPFGCDKNWISSNLESMESMAWEVLGEAGVKAWGDLLAAI